MYSWEIEQLLKLRNYLIDNETYLKICNESNQIDYIKYNPYEDNIYLHTKDNYEFKFKVYRKVK